ncbi:MAG TPA: ATP-binding cassette domain-containing protein [Chlamydiales bacterium]|nr:ATP-binding cassette domain-containing protein [Chlamydiales bacterium]
MNDLAVELEHLSFSYENLLVLERIDLQIKRGEFIGIMGPNGGGKTTLLKLLMGLLAPKRGSVAIFGKHPSEVCTKIGYVPQVHRTDRDFPITVLELILLGALSKTSFLGAYPIAVKQRAHYLIDRLGLTSHQNRLFGSLSGGLAQRALLARSLLSDPELLLLDEPTANIDAPSIAVIFELLESLKRKKTILIVTHDLRTIIERVDRVLCVQGQVSSFLPKDVCEHFALGLYHTPLLGIHSKKEAQVVQSIL